MNCSPRRPRIQPQARRGRRNREPTWLDDRVRLAADQEPAGSRGSPPPRGLHRDERPDRRRAWRGPRGTAVGRGALPQGVGGGRGALGRSAPPTGARLLRGDAGPRGRSPAALARLQGAARPRGGERRLHELLGVESSDELELEVGLAAYLSLVRLQAPPGFTCPLDWNPRRTRWGAARRTSGRAPRSLRAASWSAAAASRPAQRSAAMPGVPQVYARPPRSPVWRAASWGRVWTACLRAATTAWRRQGTSRSPPRVTVSPLPQGAGASSPEPATQGVGAGTGGRPTQSGSPGRSPAAARRAVGQLAVRSRISGGGSEGKQRPRCDSFCLRGGSARTHRAVRRALRTRPLAKPRTRSSDREVRKPMKEAIDVPDRPSGPCGRRSRRRRAEP